MVKEPISDDERKPLFASLRPDTLGHVFGVMAAVGATLFFVAFFSMFGYLLLFTPPDGAPIPLPITVVGIASWGCVTISLWAYVVWASWKLRTQPRKSEQNGEHNVLWHTGDRDRYEARQRRLFLAFGFGVFALLAPIAMIAGSNGA